MFSLAYSGRPASQPDDCLQVTEPICRFTLTSAPHSRPPNPTHQVIVFTWHSQSPEAPVESL